MGTLITLANKRKRVKETARNRLEQHMYHGTALSLDIAAFAANRLDHDTLADRLARVAHRAERRRKKE